MGQPHSGKTEMANAIMAELVASGVTVAYLNGNQLRQQFNDFDYTNSWDRQLNRIKQFIYESAADVVVVDFMHPLRRAHYELVPNMVIWMGSTVANPNQPLYFSINAPALESDMVVETPANILVKSKEAVAAYLAAIEMHRDENYANQIFAQHNNKWLVTSPGRCGGTLLTDMVKHMYARMGVTLAVYIPFTGPGTKTKLETNALVHTHTLTEIDALLGQATSHIILTRDMVATAISQCIAAETTVWHQYNHYKNLQFIDNTTIVNKPPSVQIDINMLLSHYKDRVNFYTNMAQRITPITKIIDYSTFSNNMHDILPILGFKYTNPLSSIRLPIKNEDNSTRIINYDEVLNAVSGWPRNPAEICSAYAI